MPRGALVFCLALCGLLGLPRLAVPQALVDQMPLADLQKCGALALDMTTGQQDMAATDRALKAEGAAIRAESAAVDAARRTVPLRDPAAVKRFNARVSALDIRVAAYSGEIARRNTRGQTANDVTQQFNVLCAHRPYDPEMLASLPPAQAQAMSRGATTVAIPSIDNAPDTPPPPPAGPGALVIGGPPPPGAAAGTAAAPGGFKSPADLRDAAEKGDAEAQYQLGSSLVTGGPFGRDDATGLSWLTRSADQANAKALFALSVMYDEGRGVPARRGEVARLPG